jgi:hypothetical protein
LAAVNCTCGSDDADRARSASRVETEVAIDGGLSEPNDTEDAGLVGDAACDRALGLDRQPGSAAKIASAAQNAQLGQVFLVIRMIQ